MEKMVVCYENYTRKVTVSKNCRDFVETGDVIGSRHVLDC